MAQRQTRQESCRALAMVVKLPALVDLLNSCRFNPHHPMGQQSDTSTMHPRFLRRKRKERITLRQGMEGTFSVHLKDSQRVEGGRDVILSTADSKSRSMSLNSTSCTVVRSLPLPITSFVPPPALLLMPPRTSTGILEEETKEEEEEETVTESAATFDFTLLPFGFTAARELGCAGVRGGGALG